MLLTINSAGRLLDLFTAQTPERGVTEVAVELGVSKSKSHALLASLTEVGLLQRTPVGRYRLGWRVLTLNRVLGETTEFRRHARPTMEALHRRVRQTVNLAALYDSQVIYVDRVVGPESVRPTASAVGSVLPAHCSAIGKVLLAHLGVAQLDQLVAEQGLPSLTANTITDFATLQRELALVRQRGVAVEREEAVRGVSCVAAPIVAPGPSVVAAISVSVEAATFACHEDAFRRAVSMAADRIGRRLREADLNPSAHTGLGLAAAC